MDMGFQLLDKDIKQTYNTLHNEINSSNEKLDLQFKYTQNTINQTHDIMNENFHEVKNKLKDTKLEMKQNFYFLTNQIVETKDKIYNEINKANDRIKSDEAKLSSIEKISDDHEKTLSLLTRSNNEQKELIIAQGILISEEQNKTIECIKNIKQLYVETNELKQIAKEQQNNIQNLNLISNEKTQH